MAGCVVHKFTTTIGEGVVNLPAGKVLHVDFQGGLMCVWLLRERPLVDDPVQHVYLVITGQNFTPEPRDTFVGTLLTRDGAFVVHAFLRPGAFQ